MLVYPLDGQRALEIRDFVQDHRDGFRVNWEIKVYQGQRDDDLQRVQQTPEQVHGGGKN